MHALGGLYGSTGPSKEVDYTCFNGQDAWLTFGGQLEYTLPSPEVDTGVETPAVAAIAPIGVNATGKTYRCIKQYSVGGTSLKRVTVPLGDEGLTQCAARCDEEPSACVAYMTSESGSCNLLKAISVSQQRQRRQQEQRQWGSRSSGTAGAPTAAAASAAMPLGAWGLSNARLGGI
eukprot:GHRQ01021908.1.p1 GENE.GHRQ01021908.1~~GHRQ01021908.1.p1  ORF type:complete len:203 (+),score=42.02 GHRQ01021908.1:82-609(+)